MLHGGDARMIGAVVRLLTAALLNTALDMDVLDACGAWIWQASCGGTSLYHMFCTLQGSLGLRKRP